MQPDLIHYSPNMMHPLTGSLHPLSLTDSRQFRQPTCLRHGEFRQIGPRASAASRAPAMHAASNTLALRSNHKHTGAAHYKLEFRGSRGQSMHRREEGTPAIEQLVTIDRREYVKVHCVAESDVSVVSWISALLSTLLHAPRNGSHDVLKVCSRTR